MNHEKKRSHPAEWIFAMVVAGLAIVLDCILVFTYCCGSGASADGWCAMLTKHPPWTVLSGLATIPAIVLTWIWREQHKRESERHADSQITVAQDGQVTERFTRAVEQLGSDKPPVRLGAIYALERIAKDSPQDHWTIMETLAAFVRMSAPLTNDEVNRVGGVEPDDFPSPTTDVQAALTVIGRRDPNNDPEDGTIDLSETDISGAKLNLACLKGVLFAYTNLSKVNFKEATLVGARFFKANLYGANLQSANLESASFFGASLRRAYLSGANFSGTKLSVSDLSLATIESAIGLTREQLQHVVLGQGTTLPPEFADLIPPMPEGD